MGEKNVTTGSDSSAYRAFTHAVLTDLHALERMLEGDLLEADVSRIGAEQEMFLVDSAMRPAPLSIDVIAAARDSRLTTEIGLFNLEANLTPLEFGGDCLSRLEGELNDVIDIVKRAMAGFNGHVALCGILPTIQRSDLVERNLTPNPRYTELNRVLTALHGEDRMIHLKGLEELTLYIHDTYTEFCNTSFQIHLQVPIAEFTDRYNWAQAISGPVLAPAVNSPLLLSHRLWHETRLGLFKQAVDERGVEHRERERPARVTFGHDWVDDSILEIFHEDVSRFRILFTRELQEDSMDVLRGGGVPRLEAWRMHNGTVWRWNRACYGLMNGRPGLRIEARFLPAGPSVVDEMANSAFFLGLMQSLPAEYGDVRKLLSFDDAKSNFFGAARHGLRSQMTWFDGRSYNAGDLILNELLPAARAGLEQADIDRNDSDRLLGVLEERVRAERTGARWMLDSLAAMDKAAKSNVRMRTITCEMVKNQNSGEPLHRWPLAEISENSEWIDNYRTVEQFMSRDLLTLRPDDIIDLATNLMDWKHIRHVPVENENGELVGILSHRDLLHYFADESSAAEGRIAVRDIMQTSVIKIEPETSTLEALYLMREKKIGCLPVCRGKNLVGLLTAHDFLTVSTRLLEEKLKAENA